MTEGSVSTATQPRLLGGPPLDGRAEPFASHLERLGPLPTGREASRTIGTLEASGLLGRGGAGFPVGRKWRAIAGRAGGRAVVLANGAEGEPASAKDRVLMAHRPHLVVDGAVLAAEAVDADEIVFYVGSEHEAAVSAIREAIRERRAGIRQRIRLVTAPVGYVAGEASAAVHFVDSADARPTTTPPRMSQRGVGGASTLVQNVESLAYAALIGRFGDGWYRSAGMGEAKGTALVTVGGGGAGRAVREIELGTTVGDLLADSGIAVDRPQAVLLGGYFGTWTRIDDAWDLPLDPAAMRSRRLTFGCGLVGLLPDGDCGLSATAGIVSFMAGESAGQCGPCMFGLPAIARAFSRIAGGTGRPEELEDVERWLGQIAGRGACRHPDGTAQLLWSALRVFADDVWTHVHLGRCKVTGSRLEAA